MEQVSLQKVKNQYHDSAYEEKKIRELLKQELDQTEFKIIVLDDDPTGVQTVHDVFVYTHWDEKSILQGFEAKDRLFYLLTNSRAMTEQQTIQVHRELARNIIKAAEQTGKTFLIISRGDSTLRGHYPLETQILREELETGLHRSVDGELLIPFFEAGGRYTIQNTHYVKYGDELIPAAETEFARDKTFGYTKSDLAEYIEEKTKGAYPAEAVAAISLEQVRGADLQGMEDILCGAKDFSKVIVNALEPKDLETFCVALYRSLAKGKYFLFRTAADFVKAAGGIDNQPLLKKADMTALDNGHGGILVVGSHTEKTTAQLNELKHIEKLEFIEFNSDLVLEDRLEEEIARVTALSSKLIEQGRTVVTYTKRRLLVLEQDTKEEALLRSVKISEAVLQLVQRLTVTPRFVIAKGGITSSDIGVKALGVQKAFVLGQVQPGIPVWRTDKQSRFPGIPYIIFPGNVGEKDTLKRVLEELL